MKVGELAYRAIQRCLLDHEARCRTGWICIDCFHDALHAAQNEAIERCFNRVRDGSKYLRKLNPKVKLIVFDGLEEIASDIRALKEER